MSYEIVESFPRIILAVGYRNDRFTKAVNLPLSNHVSRKSSKGFKKD